MALSLTLGTLISRCQQRSRKENDESIPTAEWKSLISEIYGELHGAVAKTGARYFETEATITATGAASYALPTDHLSTVGVDLVVDASGRRIELAELQVQERIAYAGVTGTARLFHFSGTNVVLAPNPSTGTYKHIYVPQPTDLSDANVSTSVDLISVYGLKFVVWGVTALALHKEESDQRTAFGQRDQALEEVVSWAVDRALTMPRRRVITDVDSIMIGGDLDLRYL